jgi:hypothetical protein
MATTLNAGTTTATALNVITDTTGAMAIQTSGTTAIAINNAQVVSLTNPLAAGSGGTGLSSLGTGVATFLGTPSSANLAAAVTDETGSGALVFGTSPTITSATLVTPALGTPTSGTLTNATGLPLTTGVTGTLPTANGGTNLTSFTSGGAVYATSTSALTTGTLPVASGGTGAATIAANNVVLGNGTSAVQTVAPSTSGNLLTSNGTTWQSTAPAVFLPAFGDIGSYAFVGILASGTAFPVSGNTYSCGTGSNQLQSALLSNQPSGGSFNYILTNNLTGTWRWMGGSNGATGSSYQFGIAQRIS